MLLFRLSKKKKKSISEAFFAVDTAVVLTLLFSRQKPSGLERGSVFVPGGPAVVYALISGGFITVIMAQPD